MSKNILVLTGSPRKGGNSDQLADAFIAGAERSGNTVTKYMTAFKSIKGCRACNLCYSKKNACVFDDDFNELAPLIEEAEVIVFAFPLYWFTFPMQIKAAIDKIYSIMVAGRKLRIEQCALMICAEDDRECCFDGIVRTYELITEYLEWKDIGRITLTGVNHIGDVQKTDGLQHAEKLGESIA